MSKEDRIRIPIDDETWAILQKYAKKLNITTDEVAEIAILSFTREVAPETYTKWRKEAKPKIIELVERTPTIL